VGLGNWEMGKTTQYGVLCFVSFTKYNLGDQIKKNKMGRACSLYGEGKGEMRTGFWWGNLTERGHLEGVDIDGRTKIKWIFKKWDGGHGLD
jgi:hypothetical protein